MEAKGFNKKKENYILNTTVRLFPKKERKDFMEPLKEDFLRVILTLWAQKKDGSLPNSFQVARKDMRRMTSQAVSIILKITWTMKIWQ